MAPAAQIDQLAAAFTQARGEQLFADASSQRAGGSEPTKQKLYEQACEHGIDGRSSMNKEELAEAVKAARGE